MLQVTALPSSSSVLPHGGCLIRGLVSSLSHVGFHPCSAFKSCCWCTCNSISSERHWVFCLALCWHSSQKFAYPLLRTLCSPESPDSGGRRDSVSESFLCLSLRAKHVKGLRPSMITWSCISDFSVLTPRLLLFLQDSQVLSGLKGRVSPEFTVFRRDLRKFEI